MSFSSFYHCLLYWLFLRETRPINSSSLERKSFRMGDSFDFL
jgi:hypothetical protein